MKIPKGNQNPHIEEGQTTQWPKEKAQTDKQRSTNITHKTKDGVTRTTLKPGCSGRVSAPAPLVAPVVLIYLQTR